MEPNRNVLYDYAGGFNRSMQHQLEAHAQSFQELRVVANADSNVRPSWLGVIECSRTDRFSREKYCRIN